jgi:hypothetical protein
MFFFGFSFRFCLVVRVIWSGEATDSAKWLPFKFFEFRFCFCNLSSLEISFDFFSYGKLLVLGSVGW